MHGTLFCTRCWPKSSKPRRILRRTWRSGNLVCALHAAELENQNRLWPAKPLRLKTLANKARATAQALTTAGISNQEAGQRLFSAMVQTVSYHHAHVYKVRCFFSRGFVFIILYVTCKNLYIYIYMCIYIVYIYIYLHIHNTYIRKYVHV